MPSSRRVIVVVVVCLPSSPLFCACIDSEDHLIFVFSKSSLFSRWRDSRVRTRVSILVPIVLRFSSEYPGPVEELVAWYPHELSLQGTLLELMAFEKDLREVATPERRILLTVLDEYCLDNQVLRFSPALQSWMSPEPGPSR